MKYQLFGRIFADLSPATGRAGGLEGMTDSNVAPTIGSDVDGSSLLHVVLLKNLQNP